MEIAIFPIPEMICFPGQVITLHVFEPRYRQMIKDCLKDKRELGIALPKKTIKESTSKASSVKEILKTNQSLFETCDVMGAGTVELVQELPDGRFLIEVEISHRVEVTAMIQELPYYRATVKELTDDTSKMGSPEQSERFDRLINLSKFCLEDQYSSFEDLISPEVLAEKNLTELCFRIFDWCHLLPEHMQEAIETRDPAERADFLIEALEVYLEAVGEPSVSSKESPTEAKRGELVQVDFQKKEKKPKQAPETSDSND